VRVTDLFERARIGPAHTSAWRAHAIAFAAQEHIDDVARYLTRHRISGGPRVIIHQEGSGAAQLVRLAQDEGADLIVAGAYGHSRLGEWMFGGMTRDLLATSPICCLMSH
jgi:nucleotide-binding universal stress UspA family protein